MDNEQIFSFASMTAMVGWAFLALLPMWRGSQWIAGVIVPFLLATAYGALIIPTLFMSDGGFDPSSFSSLAGVRALFENDGALLVGWIHYLAFDLFVGAWEVRDARRVGVPHLLVLPCLFFTLMFGPVGLLLYFVIRTTIKRGLPQLS